MGLKIQKCRVCGKIKLLPAFKKDKRMPTGYSYNCKECFNSAGRAYYTRNRDRVLVQHSAYRKEHRDVSRFYQREYYSKNRERKAVQGRIYRQDNRDKINACARRRFANRDREAFNKEQRNNYRLNPAPILASVAVYRNKKFGNLTKQSCVYCGNNNTVAHHWDYRKPLDVEWVCRDCHINLHKLLTWMGISITKETSINQNILH